MPTANDLHVVFGTGAIGMALIEELNRRGKNVRPVNRSGSARVPDGVDVVGGNATTTEFAKVASADAGVVHFCLNPPYTRWPELFPPMQAAAIEGAASAGAKLVVMENLYMYPPTHGQPLTEGLPHTATTRKGSVHAQMAKDLMRAHVVGQGAGDRRALCGLLRPAWLAERHGRACVLPRPCREKAQVMGDPDQLHTYSYLPDIATGLAILGEHDEADGKAWHLPNAPAVTTKQFIEQVYAAAGAVPGIQAMPRWMVNAVGLFNGNVRELKEMLYEFDEPFVVDDSKFENAFGNHATPLAEAISATVDWFRVG